MPDPTAEAKAVSGRRKQSRVRSRTGRADRAELEIRTLQAFRTVFGSARNQDAELRRLAKLSSSQLWALSEIGEQPGLTVNGLAERMALHQTTTSNLVNTLVERRLIRRVRDSDDQRIVHLHAMAEGRRMLQRLPEPHSGILVDALKHMPANELQTLGNALRALVVRMQIAAPTASWETLLGE